MQIRGQNNPPIDPAHVLHWWNEMSQANRDRITVELY